MKTCGTVFLLLASCISLLGQAPLKPVDPPELVAQKAEHLRAMSRAEIAPLTSYLQSLKALRQRYAFQSKPDAVAAIDAEINTATAALAAASASQDLSKPAAVQLQIDQALYGDFARNQTADVTDYIKKAYDSGAPTVSIHGTTMLGAKDPAPGVAKSVKVIYTLNGRRKEKLLKESIDAILDFKKDLR